MVNQKLGFNITAICLGVSLHWLDYIPTGTVRLQLTNFQNTSTKIHTRLQIIVSQTDKRRHTSMFLTVDTSHFTEQFQYDVIHDPCITFTETNETIVRNTVVQSRTMGSKSSESVQCAMLKAVTHVQTWASYSALYRFGRLSRWATSSNYCTH